jgi:ADP-ribose pyrophosphatase YjhB (NUDIX family)
MKEKWLDWAREIQSLCQTGLAFASNDYETQRYKRLIEISSEILSEHTNLDKSNLEKVLMEQPGYATPKIDVRAAVFQNNRILLVQESTDKKWAMPGGWADVGDFPAAVAERETLEESGFVVKAKKLIGVFDANRTGRPIEFFHAFKLIFLCEMLGGNPKTSSETLDVKFFDIDELPPLSENRTNLRHINEIKAHLADNSRLAFFE